SNAMIFTLRSDVSADVNQIQAFWDFDHIGIPHEENEDINIRMLDEFQVAVRIHGGRYEVGLNLFADSTSLVDRATQRAR
ncbi:hypothetical protein HPB47_025524, partial [Ixodes persulcatus]